MDSLIDWMVYWSRFKVHKSSHDPYCFCDYGREIGIDESFFLTVWEVENNELTFFLTSFPVLYDIVLHK